MYASLLCILVCISAGFAAKGDSLGIVGGRNSTITKHPYQVSITIFNKLACSGVVLNQQWVLTTASCISGVRFFPDKVSIRSSSDDYSSGGKEYACEVIHMNDQFTYLSQDYDVAVLKIKGHFKYGKKLKPIKLATKPLKVGAEAVISGWGSSNVTFYTHTIKEDDVKVLEQKECAKAYTFTTLTSRMFCAGTEDYGPCWIDDADPLVYKNRLYGLLSFNNGCFSTYYPSVYTNVPRLRTWINKTIQNGTLHH